MGIFLNRVITEAIEKGKNANNQDEPDTDVEEIYDVFIYDIEKTKNIYGISLNTCAFYGISKEKILKMIVNNQNNVQIKNFYKIPNNVRRIVNDEIPNELFLLEYFV